VNAVARHKDSAVFDVLVVGAGPAGSCVAKLLADGGASVALIDGAKFPRFKSCAGWVNAKAFREFPFLESLRSRAKAVPLRRLVFHSPDLERRAEFGTRAAAGFIVRREKFDTELLRAAVRAGAKAFLGRRVVAVESGEREIVAVLANGKRLAGRIMVGADGVHSTVARASGLRARWEPDQLILCQSKIVPLTGRQRTACFGPAAIHVALGFGMAPGYAWAFPGGGHVSVGIGLRTDDGNRVKTLYDAWVARLNEKELLPRGANLANPDGGAIPAGAALEFENHVGKRVILIGDAGGFASSASGEGIYPALLSAAVAAKCILKAVAADRAGHKAIHCQDELQTFKHLWRQHLAAYLQMPNVNVTFLLPLIYTNQEIADRFGRAFLFGENL
jgi:geranylgeranyl reductase family protein